MVDQASPPHLFANVLARVHAVCEALAAEGAVGLSTSCGFLALYQKEHRRIGRRPAFMADFMLLLDGRDRFRARVLRAFARQPELFRGILAAHVGRSTPAAFAANSLALSWRMLRDTV